MVGRKVEWNYPGSVYGLGIAICSDSVCSFDLVSVT